VKGADPAKSGHDEPEKQSPGRENNAENYSCAGVELDEQAKKMKPKRRMSAPAIG